MRQIDQDLLKFAKDFQQFMGRHNKGFKYSSIFDLFLKEGRIFDSQPYTKDEEKQILEALKRSGEAPQIKACYKNAQSLAMASKLGYAEGYVVSHQLPVPIEHAFNVLPSGKVVDVTMRPMGEKDTCSPKKLLERAKKNQENAYLGITIPVDEVRKSWLRTGWSLQLVGSDPVVMDQIFDRGYPASWKSPAVSGPRPEEEWLNEPEREDAPADETRSPFEGDIPPWAQRGYPGVFPMSGKVFYITAYIGHGPAKVSRKPAVPSPVMGEAFQIQDVGSMPTGTQFGSEFMFYRFAAIPIRQEDRNEAGPIVDYLDGLIQELGAFGKILIEEEFPSGNSVKLPGGRWFPVDETPREYGGVKFLNAYSVNRIYGGPQEGGWWFDEGYPIASIPLREEDPAAKIEWEAYLTAKVAWTSQYDKGSVLGHDVFEMGLEDNFARHYPEETPRYE